MIRPHYDSPHDVTRPVHLLLLLHVHVLLRHRGRGGVRAYEDINVTTLGQ